MSFLWYISLSQFLSDKLVYALLNNFSSFFFMYWVYATSDIERNLSVPALTLLWSFSVFCNFLEKFEFSLYKSMACIVIANPLLVCVFTLVGWY